MKKQIVNALVKKYEGEIAEAKANIEIYMNNPVGIGEHPDVLDAINSQVLKIATAEENKVRDDLQRKMQEMMTSYREDIAFEEELEDFDEDFDIEKTIH